MLINKKYKENLLKIIFAGTPNFAAYHLNTLLKNNFTISAVLTAPDSPNNSFHRNKFIYSPVKQLAIKHNILLLQPDSLFKKEYYKEIIKLKADIMVVVAYGKIFPEFILKAPKFGCINIHGSLLPRWRGPAPIQRAIIAGDQKTGITIIQMKSSIDTGDILHQIECPIEATDTSATLFDKLSNIGTRSMLITLNNLLNGTLNPKPQQELFATYANKISKKEALINWNQSSLQIDRYIRAFNPWPISYFMSGGIRIKVWQASIIQNYSHYNYNPGEIVQFNKNGLIIATAQDFLNLQKIQPAGKIVMKISDFFNSRKKILGPGTIL
ncbi:MAG: methionyl-tRNA formyltransferase [Candidatus Dasytiphilus stammeri]